MAVRADSTAGCRSVQTRARAIGRLAVVLPAGLVFFTARRRLFIRRRASPWIFIHAGWPRRAARDSYRRARFTCETESARIRRHQGRRHRWLPPVVLLRGRGLRRLGNQVEPRASRDGYGALVHEGGEKEREESVHTKAAIFREGNQRRAFRAAYHQATPPPLPPPPPPLPLPPFIPPRRRRRRPPYRLTLVLPGFGSISLHRGLFPQPVAQMNLTDEK